jgi:hypothetical protein
MSLRPDDQIPVSGPLPGPPQQDEAPFIRNLVPLRIAITTPRPEPGLFERLKEEWGKPGGGVWETSPIEVVWPADGKRDILVREALDRAGEAMKAWGEQSSAVDKVVATSHAMKALALAIKAVDDHDARRAPLDMTPKNDMQSHVGVENPEADTGT